MSDSPKCKKIGLDGVYSGGKEMVKCGGVRDQNSMQLLVV